MNKERNEIPHGQKKEDQAESKNQKTEQELEQELEQTFPASDPPSYSMQGNEAGDEKHPDDV